MEIGKGLFLTSSGYKQNRNKDKDHGELLFQIGAVLNGKENSVATLLLAREDDLREAFRVFQ